MRDYVGREVKLGDIIYRYCGVYYNRLHIVSGFTRNGNPILKTSSKIGAIIPMGYLTSNSFIVIDTINRNDLEVTALLNYRKELLKK